jgi:hypothetical protein
MKRLVLDYFLYSKMPFLKPSNVFINILSSDVFSKFSFFRSRIKLYISNKRIFFIKIFNKIFKLISLPLNFSFNNINFFSCSSFFFENFFFFNFNGRFLKFFVKRNKTLIFDRFLSLRKAKRRNLSLNNNSFFFKFLVRYSNFYKKNIFAVNNKFFVVYKSFRSICEFLIKKYKFKRSLVFLKYIVTNSYKK